MSTWSLWSGWSPRCERSWVALGAQAADQPVEPRHVDDQIDIGVRPGLLMQ
jgi:hypothetical protein